MTVIAIRYCKGWARDWRSKAYRQVRRIAEIKAIIYRNPGHPLP
jgi:hypothetical protein